MRDFGDEFADMDSDLGPSTSPEGEGSARASGQDAGPLGFAGTVRKDAVGAVAGLARLSSNGFGDGPRMPMVPGSWDSDAAEGEGDDS
jgi:PPE-repeat protein